MTRGARILAAALSVFGTAVLADRPGVAQQFPAAADATFTVTPADGRSTYKVGERIPLLLEFTGRAGPEYELLARSGDRSPIETERYIASPTDGLVDPLADYFAAFPRIGSGLYSLHALDGTPFRLTVDLNQWLRFDRPGEYELVVTSSRLRRRAPRATIELRSNPVRIRIEPADDDWAAAELARAVAAIDEGIPDRVRDGISALRYLGTRAAAIALVDRYFLDMGDLGFVITAGLVGSPYRADVVAAMAARLDVAAPVPPAFISDLSHLRVLLELPRGASAASAMERARTVEAEYNRRWLEAIRRGPATPETIESAMIRLERTSDDEFAELLSGVLAERPVTAQEALLSLPARVQDSLLRRRWPVMNRSWIPPALEALYEGWRGDFRFAGAGDAALTRLSEIDPARAQTLALDEIRTGRHGIATDTLTAVVTGPIPDVDTALVERYRAASRYATPADLGKAGSAAWLIARYGSSSLLPVVTDALRAGLPCDVEAGLITYLLRHDVPAAIARLSNVGRRDGCVAPPLDLVASRVWNGRLEELALTQLQSETIAIAVRAARLLGRYGSAEVGPPLLERLMEWEAQWRGRSAELDALSAARESPELLENALVDALLRNKRIALGDPDIARIRALCVTDRCRGNVTALSPGRSTPIN